MSTVSKSYSTERPDKVHGRLQESVHIGLYSFERAVTELKWLLEDDRWMQCGDGYDDIDGFLDSIDFSEFKIEAEQRRELSKMLAEKRASNRRIAKAVGVTETTIRRDVNGATNVARDNPEDSQSVTPEEYNNQEQVTAATNVAGQQVPPSFFVGAKEEAKAVQKTINKQYEKAKTYNHNEGDEWYTPKWLFDSLGITFDIDVCGPVDRTHVTTPAHQHFTEEDDGLTQEWSGTIWCNPPYSNPQPWVDQVIAHGDGLLLTHIPMNAEWAAKTWGSCDGLRLFQAIEFVRPDGTKQRPGMWLQLAAFGERAAKALEQMKVPEDVAENPRRVPSPMFIPKGVI